MLEKQLKFKSSAELFDAGYAVSSYSIDTNENNWRFKGGSFTTPRIMFQHDAYVNGTRVPVYPITELEKYRVGKTN